MAGVAPTCSLKPAMSASPNRLYLQVTWDASLPARPLGRPAHVDPHVLWRWSAVRGTLLCLLWTVQFGRPSCQPLCSNAVLFMVENAQWVINRHLLSVDEGLP